MQYPSNLSFANCAKGPSAGGLPIAELKELAKKMGINPNLVKAEICAEMAKVFNMKPTDHIPVANPSVGVETPLKKTPVSSENQMASRAEALPKPSSKITIKKNTGAGFRSDAIDAAAQALDKYLETGDISRLKMVLSKDLGEDFVQAINSIGASPKFISDVTGLVTYDYLFNALSRMDSVDYAYALSLIKPDLAKRLFTDVLMYHIQNDSDHVYPLFDNAIKSGLVNFTPEEFIALLERAIKLANEKGSNYALRTLKKIGSEYMSGPDSRSSESGFRPSDGDSNYNPNISNSKCKECVDHLSKAGLWQYKSGKLSKEEVKALNRDFKKWALQNHPDKGGDSEFFSSVSSCRDYYNDGSC